MGRLKEATENQELAERTKPRSLEDLMKANWHKIEAVMPKHMSSERLFQLAVSTVRHDPKLAECDITTLMSCLMRCSALGLEPSSVDGLGRAYILPFWNSKTNRREATFILGYKGMIDLARRSGEIKDISARTVHEGDVFEYEFGLDERLVHIPGKGPRTPETMTHSYMVCHFTNGGHFFDVMTKEEVDGIRERSKSPKSGPWVTDYLAMARKSPTRRSFPYLPVSVEAQMAAAADETSGGYTQDIAPVFAGALPDNEASAAVEAEEITTTGDDTADRISEETFVPRRATCTKCGHSVEVAADATLEDLASVACCEEPAYEWES